MDDVHARRVHHNRNLETVAPGKECRISSAPGTGSAAGGRVGDGNWQHRIGLFLTLILTRTLLLDLPLPQTLPPLATPPWSPPGRSRSSLRLFDEVRVMTWRLLHPKF
jgi:hypothetical protein